MALDIVAFFVTVPLVILTLAFVYFVRSSSEPDPPPIPGAAPTAARRRWERARRTGYWASTVILALVYMSAGLPKLTGLNDLMHRFSEWGYSENFMLFIGASEFVAAIFLLIPATSLYAATYLGVIMVGAIYTHLAFDPVIWVLLPAFCLSFLGFIAYEDWQRRKSSDGRAWLPTGRKARGHSPG